MSENGDIILYQSEDGEIQIEVNLDGETAWLTLDQMAKLFQRDKSVIGKHIKNVLESGELVEDSVSAKFAITAQGDRRIYRKRFRRCIEESESSQLRACFNRVSISCSYLF